MSIPFASTVLGVIEFLIEWAIGFVTSFVSFIITMVTAIFSRLLYFIGTQLMGFVDFAQTLFRRLVGLESYWYEGVLQESTIGDNPTDFLGTIGNDPLIHFITEESILEVLLAITIIAFALLLMATFIQIIRVQYTQEGAKNTVGNLVGQTLKALAMFLIVPIGCVMGIFVSNQILAAVDAATNNSGSTTISGAIFVASASSANRMRVSVSTLDDDNVFLTILDTFNGVHITVSDGRIVEESANDNGLFTSNKTTASERAEEIAQIIDTAFAMKYENNNPDISLFGKYYLHDISNTSENIALLFTLTDAELSSNFAENVVATYFNYQNPKMVQAYYDLTKIDYLVMYLSCGLVIWSLYLSIFGLIIRVYKTIILFVISPAATAIMPIDGGNAFKSWRTSFLEAVLGAYGVIVTLNLFIIILPMLKNIQLFDPSSFQNYYYNNFVYLLFVVVGCYSFKKLSGMISKLIGGEDVLETGGEMAGKATAMAASLTPMGGALAAGRGFAALSHKNSAKKDRASRDEKLEGAEKAYKAGNYEEAEKLNSEANAFNDSAKQHDSTSGKYLEKFNSNAGVSKVVSGYKGTVGAMGLSDVYGAAKSGYSMAKDKHNENEHKRLIAAGKDVPLTEEEKQKALGKNTKEIADHKAKEEAQKQALYNMASQNPEAVKASAATQQQNVQKQANLLNNFNSKDMSEILDKGDMNFANQYTSELKGAATSKELQSDNAQDNEHSRDLLSMIDTDLKRLQDIMARKGSATQTATDENDAQMLKSRISQNVDEVVKNGNSIGAANMMKQEAVINYASNPTIEITNDQQKQILSALDETTKNELTNTVQKAIKEQKESKKNNEELGASIAKSMKENIVPKLEKLTREMAETKKAAESASDSAKKAAKKK